jgi:hypothetical protein
MFADIDAAAAACERGRLRVELTLSPEAQPGIRKLVFTAEQ